MDFLMLSLIFLVLAIVGALVLVFVKMKKKKEDPVPQVNYQVFFSMGIVFTALGVVFTAAINPGFFGFIALGLIYMIIGLANRDKWSKKENEKSP
jgi:hypothetical protein